MKKLEYETANPGQDFDEHEQEHFDPEKHTSRPPPVVSVQTSDKISQKYGESYHANKTSGQEYYDPDGTKAFPDSPITGKGRHKKMSAMKGSRKEAGFEPGKEESQKAIRHYSDIYDAAPNAETSHVSG